MELAQARGRRFEKTAQDFFDWTKRPYGWTNQAPNQIFLSLEQLWLGYVMHVKYAKYWYEKYWSKQDV
jgi:hypothetical protein